MLLTAGWARYEKSNHPIGIDHCGYNPIIHGLEIGSSMAEFGGMLVALGAGLVTVVVLFVMISLGSGGKPPSG